MVEMSLTESNGLTKQPCNNRLLRKMGLGHNTKAGKDTVNRFFQTALNGVGKKRLVDACEAYAYACRGLGSSLDWIVGFQVSEKYREFMADTVNAGLRSFLNGEEDSGVIVLHREIVEGEFSLLPVEGSSANASGVPDHASLLIPTGATSPQIGDEVVYLRLDVERSHDRKSMFSASVFLFSDRNGRSLAGFGAVPAYIVNIDGVPMALKHTIGVYDVIGVNASIFEAWWRHSLTDPTEESFVIPLDETDSSGRPVSLIMERDIGTSWYVSIEIGDDTFSLAECGLGKVIEIDADEAYKERVRLVEAFKACDDPSTAIGYEHIFDEEHIGRFSEEFQEELENDPQSGIAKFVGEVKRAIGRLRADPLSWPSTMFPSGEEKELEFNGDAAMTRIQLLAPLYLTDRDAELARPSVYVVAAINRSSDGGGVYCAFPTVLDNGMVESNRRIMRRAIRNSMAKAA